MLADPHGVGLARRARARHLADGFNLRGISSNKFQNHPGRGDPAAMIANTYLTGCGAGDAVKT